MNFDGVYELDSGKNRMSMSSSKQLVILSIVMFLCGVVVLIVGIVLGVRATQTANNVPCVQPDKGVAPTTPSVPTTQVPEPTPSPSIEGHYRFAGVATDTEICSKVGTLFDIDYRLNGTEMYCTFKTYSTIKCDLWPYGNTYEITVLKIFLTGYNFTPYDLMTPEKTILAYHRIVEAFKFDFVERSAMGDADVENQEFKDKIENLVKNLTSQDYGNDVRSRLNDDTTQKASNYGPAFSVLEDGGTGHMSLLATNGDAVATTSTVNLYFGSKVVGSETGIVYNDEMDDFSTPNTTNFWDVPASKFNFIKPGKRPLSSMAPAIIVEDDGDVSLVVGASGGTHIITSSALTIIDTLWFGKGIKASVDYPRIHHQLFPKFISVQNGFPQYIIDGLKAKGRDVTMYENAGSTVQGILQKATNQITASSDYRKYGIPDGY
ncbi:glutathione hydrolase light chain 1-like [Gigantopelta aegis]|uniref:glutathione hydrolase light chain 1-like n=1 Tax=Gigantopelta aegis TaxID=1735272 RepID=UPI001B887D24|nr:glutathione hydrolase light chain 1-like [Gigantopelta aegis]